MAQKFVENVFETHVDWIELINNDDNYKNILQVKIQKEFKTTPHYIEIAHDIETGYHMGVYLCLGQQIYEVNHEDALPYSQFGNFQKFKIISKIMKKFCFLGEGTHKIKKVEQFACNEALACFG